MRIVFLGLSSLLGLACLALAQDGAKKVDKAAEKAQNLLNQAVLKYCKDNLGKKVGSGECADLAVKALDASKAKAFGTYKDSPNEGDYVWGEQVFYLEASNGKYQSKGEAKKLKPGDIIQFRDGKWAGRQPNGRGTYTQSYPHHTAIISEVAYEGQLWKILHQNTDGKKEVVEGVVNLADMREGWLRVYRPVVK